MNPPGSPGIPDEQLRKALARRPDPVLMADDLASIVETANRTRQRRPLLSALSAGTARLTRVAVLVGAVALLVAVLIALAIIAGSRHRLPPPFGPARAGLLAFDLGGNIFVANPDGSGRRQLTKGPSDGGETFSPDGTEIAYQASGPDMSTSLIVMGADGGHPTTVADHLAEVGDIVWSPDSRRIAFGGHIFRESGFHVFVAALDHPGAIRLGGPDLFGVEPAWSPDGRYIAFKHIDSVDASYYGDGALWLMNADGSDPRRLAKAGGSSNALFNTAWSPDSKRLAFLAGGVGGKYDVYVINADGTGERDITNTPQDEFWPSWSPDGSRIAFSRMSLTVQNQGKAIVVDPDGSHPIVLDGPPINSNTLIWSPDGTRLLGYAKNPDPSLDYNVGISVFDPSASASPTTIPADQFGSATWQRLAP